MKFDQELQEVLLKIPSDEYSKVRAALSMSNKFKYLGKNYPISFITKHASSSLLSFAGPERFLT